MRLRKPGLARRASWPTGPMSLGLLATIALGAGLLAPAPALAQVKAAQLADVGPNHWAFSAIQALVDKYRVMGGYPDKTFRGQRTVSRYELAAALVNVMDRIDELSMQPGRVTNQDKATVERLKSEFASELASLSGRVATLESKVQGLESEVKSLKGSLGNLGNNGSRVTGGVGLTILDDPEDRLMPYAVTDFYARFNGTTTDGTTYSATLAGYQKAAATGATPVIHRGEDPTESGKAPGSGVSLGGTVTMTTKHPQLGAMNFRVGRFSSGSLIDTGGFAAHWGDGLMGVGLKAPSAVTARMNSDIGIGSSFKLGQLGVAAVLNSVYVFTGASYDFGLGNVVLLGDFDHNSVGAVELQGDPAYNLTAALNLGSDQLGLSLQGSLKKEVPYFSALLTTNVFGAELSGGFGTRSEPNQGVFELVPAAYAFYPKLPYLGWSLLFAATEPQTIMASSDGTAGPGSLLGTKAGVTLQVGIPNPYIPNLTVEFDRMSGTLLGDYDGMGYAVNSSVRF